MVVSALAFGAGGPRVKSHQMPILATVFTALYLFHTSALRRVDIHLVEEEEDGGGI